MTALDNNRSFSEIFDKEVLTFVLHSYLLKMNACAERNKSCKQVNHVDEKIARHVGVIVKVTRDCNLRCKYCYMEKQENPDTEKVMDYRTLENMIRKFTKSFHNVSFVWHGGEPLVPGLDFYKRVVELQSKYKNGGRVKNSMQTNGVLANDQILDFLTKEKISIGVSIDGPPEVNDKVRLLCSGKGATRKIEAGLKRIQKYQKPGVLCVVSKQNADSAEGVYQNLKNKEVQSVKFQPYEGTDPELMLDNKSYFGFHRKIYDLWINDHSPLNGVSPISDIVKKFLGGKKVPSKVTGNCFRSNLDIDVNGDIYPCAALGVEDYKLGNINTTPLDEVFNSEKRISLLEKHRDLQNKCQSECQYFPVCQSGCIRVNFLSGKDMFAKNYFCEGKKELFSYIVNDLAERLDLNPGNTQS